MKLNFCTLFNSNYLARGLTLYHSLEEVCADFHLYVFAFDKAAEDFLKAKNYPHLTVVGLSEFEDPELLRVKPTRSPAEFCWTCTPSTILYSIEKFGLDHCTYLDADMRFYHDPAILIKEMGAKDVLLTDHNYTASYDQSAVSGRFCVQFVLFRNTPNGMKALRWWRESCNEWCYARAEDGKFGDQKYLDDWETRFEGVHVLRHPGGGVAPWNVLRFDVFRKNKKPFIRVKETGEVFPLVFFHFHGVKFFTNKVVQLCGPAYDVHEDFRFDVYFPYLRELVHTEKSLRENGVAFDPNGASGTSPLRPWGIRILLFYYLGHVKNSLKDISGKFLADRRRHHHYYFTSSFGD